MKTISIKELHAETGRWVRAAKTQIITVTDRGEEVAELRPLTVTERPKAKLNAKERLAWMPAVAEDSTRYISEDRDGR